MRWMILNSLALTVRSTSCSGPCFGTPCRGRYSAVATQSCPRCFARRTFGGKLMAFNLISLYFICFLSAFCIVGIVFWCRRAGTGFIKDQFGHKLDFWWVNAFIMVFCDPWSISGGLVRHAPLKRTKIQIPTASTPYCPYWIWIASVVLLLFHLSWALCRAVGIASLVSIGSPHAGCFIRSAY